MEFKKLSIIIPVYNEEKTIAALLEKVKNAIIPLEKDIIVVDDGSKDGSAEILKNIDGIRLILHTGNKGKGSAIRTGLNSATGDIIVIQDADLEYDPRDYGKLIKPILENKTAVVYGSRILNKDNKKQSGILFYAGGKLLSFLTNLLYSSNITDEPTCYKVFRADVIRNIGLKCKGFEFCPEVTAKILKKGIKIYEVPISYNPRTIEEGKKINWKDGARAICTLVKYRFKS
jgi:glycosyltransferase involved in cell wall biosynthesis